MRYLQENKSSSSGYFYFFDKRVGKRDARGRPLFGRGKPDGLGRPEFCFWLVLDVRNIEFMIFYLIGFSVLMWRARDQSIQIDRADQSRAHWRLPTVLSNRFVCPGLK